MPQKNKSPHTFNSAKEVLTDFIRAYHPSKDVCRLEVKILPIDQMDWLAAQKAAVKVFGANQDDSAAIAGVGEAISLCGSKGVKFAEVLPQLRWYLNPAHPYLQWYGGFCFDAPSDDKLWEGFGSWRFVMPRFELARDKDRMIFSCNLTGVIDHEAVIKELHQLRVVPHPEPAGNFKVRLRLDSPKSVDWTQMVKETLGGVGRGDYQKLVLARKTDLLFENVLNPWTMLKTLKKVTPESYHFAFQFGRSIFLGASPERLYKRRGRQIFSEALAGTKPNQTRPQVLLNSVKDRHEHKLVVQAIADALKPLCKDLKFASRPSIKTLSNGHHLITRFQGRLKEGVKDENILDSLHPTPAVGGAPRPQALKVIRRMEPFDRGWYAGPLGYVGLDWVEFVVGIRSGVVRGKKLSVFAGAGIVEGSKASDEWKEIDNKISNFIKIIK